MTCWLTQPHRQTDRQTDSFWPVILLAQPLGWAKSCDIYFKVLHTASHVVQCQRQDDKHGTSRWKESQTYNPSGHQHYNTVQDTYQHHILPDNTLTASCWQSHSLVKMCHYLTTKRSHGWPDIYILAHKLNIIAFLCIILIHYYLILHCPSNHCSFTWLEVKVGSTGIEAANEQFAKTCCDTIIMALTDPQLCYCTWPDSKRKIIIIIWLCLSSSNQYSFV